MTNSGGGFPMNRISILVLGCLGAVSTSSRVAIAGGEVDYNRDIKPILSTNCFRCHGPDEHERKADLRLDLFEGATRDLGGYAAIRPGESSASELVARVTQGDPDEVMPPPKAGPALSFDEIDKLKRWIDSGAEYAPHWSFVKPVRHEPPAVREGESRIHGAIDRFVTARLEEEGLAPAPEADPHVLIRRLFLDLIGLPPQPDDVASFARAYRRDAESAFESLVDKLLAHEGYGEHWAAMWLDLARYADSMGYASDNVRSIWAYRDWVINAFNANMPYDQFTLEQLAGDLLPNATPAQIVATAFHRNTMNNTEGGTDNEEYRVAAVKDRVGTTMNVWMGLTMRCAECHSHKYDPISQEEYYRFYDFFNQTVDVDTNDDAPTIPVPGAEESGRRAEIEREIAALRAELESVNPGSLAAEQEAWEVEFRGHTEWTSLRFEPSRSINGANLTVEEDGSVFVSGPSPKNDTYNLITASPLETVTGFRLEAIPDKRLPGGGSGRSPEGRFILSRFAAELDTGAESPRGRFVRVSIPGENRLLHLAEVEVFSGGGNVARAGEASQSSTGYGGDAGRANDGMTDGDYQKNSVSHTAGETDPWWEVDLRKAVPVERIAIWNRTDNKLQSRLDGYRIELLDEGRKVVWEKADLKGPNASEEFVVGGKRQLAFAKASADYSHEDYPVMRAVARTSGNQAGWDVAPYQKQGHEAFFVFKEPVAIAHTDELTVTLDHHFNYGGQLTLGRFRISVTDDASLVKRAALSPAMLRIIDKDEPGRTKAERESLARYFRDFAPSLAALRTAIAKLEKKRDAIKPPTVPVMAELNGDQRRATHIQARGNFMDLEEAVEAGVPAAFHPFPGEAPKTRAGVARWLTDPDNPLTARVAVNRIWARLFGIGLVETEEDFGSQGTYPSHPMLLDWLATEYVRLGWDTKAIIKTIVSSATYRQSSKAPRERYEQDPFNRLLARGPRFRLDAERVRDQALALSGLLVERIGGPSVYPPQPPGMWRAAFNGKDTNWATSEGEDRYRRGLYTFWRRSVPYPSMATFDAPSREVCSLRRIRTNTPLQALVTLNDPVYVEIARAMARRIVNEGGQSEAERIEFALRLVLIRPPGAGEIERVTELYRAELEQFQKNPESAKDFVFGEGKGEENTEPVDLARLAAWISVANVLMNLDAVLTKS